MTGAAQLLVGVLGGIVIAVLVVLFATSRRTERDSLSDLIDAVAEPKSEPTPKVAPVDQHLNTAAAHLQPDAPIEPTWATVLLAEIAALPEVTR